MTEHAFAPRNSSIGFVVDGEVEFSMRVLVAVSMLAASMPASEAVFQSFDPRPTPPQVSWRMSAGTRWDAPADSRSGTGDIGIDRQVASASWLGVRGACDEVWIDARASRTNIAGNALLSSGVSPSGDYEETALGSTWRHLLGHGNLIGASAMATLDWQSSHEDALEWGGSCTAFGRIGLGSDGRDGVLVALNYNPDRPILGDFPILPLLAWQGQRGGWSLLLGVPFSMVSYRTDTWGVRSVIGPLPSISMDRHLYGPLRATIDARWTQVQWRRADRIQDKDRLVLSEWEWSGGLRLDYGPMMQFDGIGGISTARRLGEDVQSTDARRNGIALDVAPFVAFRARLLF